jgi:hypothetical protein
MNLDRRKVTGAAILLFVVSLSACLLFVSAYSLPPVHDDAVGYLSIARHVAEGHGFTQDGMMPAVYRPPLFSALLGSWFFLTGTSSVLSAAIFQSLLHAAGVLVAFLLFLELAPSLVWATGAALFLAVNPLLVTRVVFVLQEPTLLLFTTLAAWLSVRLVRVPSTPRAAMAGAAWGLCTLAKAVAWFAPFLLLAMRFLPGRLRIEWRGREAVAMLVCFVAVIAPWTARNYSHFHRLIPVNGQGEGMLEWNVSHAEIPGEPPGSEYAAEVYRKELPEVERKTLLWRYILDHPAYFFGYRIVRNAIHFANPARDWWWERGLYGPGDPRPWYWGMYDMLHRILFLCLLYRGVQALRGRTLAPVGFVALFACAYWGMYAVLWGEGRFALAIYPLLAAMPLTWGDH